MLAIHIDLVEQSAEGLLAAVRRYLAPHSGA
jgi:hypothetical protein